MNILLITGWGLGTHLLTPFAMLLREKHHVDVWDIFDPNQTELLKDKVNLAAQYDLLMGWSLGGELAIYLAHQILQQHGVAKPVIAYMSNPCFVANEDWSSAMPIAQFMQFEQAAQHDMLSTLKRFSHLVCMGSQDSRNRAKLLQNQLINIDLNYQKKHLYLLKQLNLVPILQTYSAKILFIFSEKDSLVPCKVMQEDVFYQQNLIQVKKINASHDAILFDSKLVFAASLDFLQQC
jgi:pimeloyl-[acyl-carrier protein] methyl ester esterase